MPCCCLDLRGIRLVSLHYPQNSCSLCIYNFQSRECWLGSIHSTFWDTQIFCNGILCCAFPILKLPQPPPAYISKQLSFTFHWHPTKGNNVYCILVGKGSNLHINKVIYKFQLMSWEQVILFFLGNHFFHHSIIRNILIICNSEKWTKKNIHSPRKKVSPSCTDLNRLLQINCSLADLCTNFWNGILEIDPSLCHDGQTRVKQNLLET